MLAINIAKRIAVSIVGGTVLLLGVIMIVTPGPAFVVIPVGLGILAIEFTWARRWLRKTRDLIGQATNQNIKTDKEKPL